MTRQITALLLMQEFRQFIAHLSPLLLLRVRTNCTYIIFIFNAIASRLEYQQYLSNIAQVNTTMTGSPPESKALAIAPKFTAFLSICGSFAIFARVIRSPKRRQQIMHRIMLGLSTADILTTATLFASTWPIPKDTLSVFGDKSQPVYGAIGSERSCNVSGFFNQFLVANPLFNTTLATYYLLTVYYGWNERQIKRVEWLFYTIPTVYAIITSIFVVAANLIGSVEWTCWIHPKEAIEEDGDPTAIQSRFRMFQWILLFGPVWACVIYLSIIFTMLYRKMRGLEEKNKRYVPRINRDVTLATGTMTDVDQDATAHDAEANDIPQPSGGNSNTGSPGNGGVIGAKPRMIMAKIWNSPEKERTKSEQIARQGMLYVIAFYITWLFPTITRFFQIKNKSPSFLIQFMDTFLLPLQGFMNFFIYFRPALFKYRKSDPSAGIFRSLKAVITAKD